MPIFTVSSACAAVIAAKPAMVRASGVTARFIQARDPTLRVIFIPLGSKHEAGNVPKDAASDA
jgi:hypothetical protein